MGQLPPGAVRLIETVQDLNRSWPMNHRLAYITQTTLSVDDTAEIVNVLRRRFPDIAGPHKEDICYATTNRQEAVESSCAALGRGARDRGPELVELHAPRGSRLACRGQAVDAGPARLGRIDWSMIGDARVVGLTAGASAPDVLVPGSDRRVPRATT